jgi:hypothetical protein
MNRSSTTMVVGLLFALASAAGAASWHNGPWGKSVPGFLNRISAGCDFSYAGKTAHGFATTISRDHDAIAYNSGGTAPFRRVQVRGKSLIFNNWGYGAWARAGVATSSRHDCGSESCGYSSCRVAIYH